MGGWPGIWSKKVYERAGLGASSAPVRGLSTERTSGMGVTL